MVEAKTRSLSCEDILSFIEALATSTGPANASQLQYFNIFICICQFVFHDKYDKYAAGKSSTPIRSTGLVQSIN